MAEFSYQGIDKSGKKVQGKLNVGSEGDVRMALRGQGVRPTRINKVSALNTDLGSLFSGGVAKAEIPLETLLVFTRQLHVLITSGIPIVQALEILADQTSNKDMKSIVSMMKEKVSTGAYFWEALAGFPKAF